VAGAAAECAVSVSLGYLSAQPARLASCGRAAVDTGERFRGRGCRALLPEWPGPILRIGGGEVWAGTPPVQSTAHVSLHGGRLRPSPASDIAISPGTARSDSSSPVVCQPSPLCRLPARRNCRRRGGHCWSPRGRLAPGVTTSAGLFSCTGISWSSVSRVKLASMDASLGSPAESPSSMARSACCSRVFKLINTHPSS